MQWIYVEPGLQAVQLFCSFSNETLDGAGIGKLQSLQAALAHT